MNNGNKYNIIWEISILENGKMKLHMEKELRKILKAIFIKEFL